jgi:uncharacterized protein YbcI
MAALVSDIGRPVPQCDGGGGIREAMTEVETRPGGAGEHDGRLRVAISNALVAIWKEHYGRGPTSARTFLESRFVFVVLEDGLTCNEQTLLNAGHEQAVRDFRLCFQETMYDAFRSTMEELTRRQVMAHECQFSFAPAMTFEIFVLDGPAVAS